MVVSTAVAHRIPAGWYPDRDDPARRRWWDGSVWTEHYAPVTGPLTTASSAALRASDATDPRMTALIDSIAHHVDAVIVSVPGPALRARTGHAVTPAAGRVPLFVIVLLAGLTGANTVLLGILASGR